MRLSSLSLATILVLSSAMLAQHTSGGGSGGSSSGSSGGGSHSSSSGGSSYSGNSGSHNSGGASSGGSYNSGGHSSGSSGGSHGGGGGHGAAMVRGDGPSRNAGSDAVLHGPAVSGANSYRGVERDPTFVQTPRTGRSLLNVARPAREPREGVQLRNVPPEKRSFFSFLRHPFRKPALKDPETLRGPLCFKGRCPVRPPGKPCTTKNCKNQVAVTSYPEFFCPLRVIWPGGTCLSQTRFLDDCAGLRAAFERQAAALREAAATLQSACVGGVMEQCSVATSAWQSEMNLYQQLKQRYESCQQQQRYSSHLIPDGFWFAPQFRLEY